MRRLYGQIREAFGWKNAEIHALSIEEAEEIIDHWGVEPPLGVVLRARYGVASMESAEPPDEVPKTVTPEELERIMAAEREFATKFGTGNPWR